MSTATDRLRWLEIAESLKPILHRTPHAPRRLVKAVADADAYQGWAVQTCLGLEQLPQRTFGRGEADNEITFDFGDHFVGYFHLTLTPVGTVDAPMRLRFVFAEVPSELGEPFDPYDGLLSRAWLQDETITLDDLPAVVRLPRRYAFRYVKVIVIDTAPSFRVRISQVGCEAVTSADDSAVPPLPPDTPADLVDLDRLSLRTLRSCMQTVFEDGPKRDRRLWLGDLRLQALTNAVTFGNFSLVKRCLYLFAAFPRPDGLIHGDVYEKPTPTEGGCSVMDYQALFAPTLLDYAQSSGDWDTVRDLWPVVLDQTELLRFVDANGLFNDPGGWWIFIDWADGLDKQAAMHAVLIYMLRQTLSLAYAIGRSDQVPHAKRMLDRMIHAGRELLWDPVRQLFHSGEHRQISYASQAWMTIAGVVEPERAAAALKAVADEPAAIPPAGPYLWHHVVQAMHIAGMHQQANDLLRNYWGQMIARGADTFWELFDPKNERFTPYRSFLLNSHCHAWSCTPAYFIRTSMK